MFASILNRSHVLLQFCVVSSIFTLCIICAYFTLSSWPTGVLGSIFALSIFAYYMVLVALISFSLLPVIFIPYINGLVIIPKIIIDFMLIGNFFVFRMYKFHIDMMFVNMAIHDAKGIGISGLFLLIAFFVFLICIVINVYIYRKAQQGAFNHTVKAFSLIFVLLIVGQFINAWGVYFNQKSITQLKPYFPYFSAATATRNFDRWKKSFPFIVPAEAGTDNSAILSTNTSKGLFDYPKQPLSYKANVEQPNILLFVLESWRFDALTKDVMPHMHQFAEENTRFSQHFSGGNVTISGLFSLLYGLHPTYMPSAQSNPFEYQTLLTKSLSQQGYTIQSHTSSNLTRFSMRQMFFGHIEDRNFNMFTQGKQVDMDLQTVASFKQSLLAEDKRQPWFKFVFLTSSHHSYQYPDNYLRFKPIPKNSEGFIFDQNINAKPYLNDYHNSLSFMDALFAEILAAVKDQGDDNTMIIVTSDHGEEFNDNQDGHWGHGGNFTAVQTHVPLIIKLPKQNIARVIDKRSAHVDVVPTILLQVGVENTVADFSSGFDLFSLPEQRNIIATSYKDKAYILGDTVYSSGIFTDSYSLFDFKMKNDSFDFKRIQAVKEEERYFFSDN